MGVLGGIAQVHYKGKVYVPGDELPSALDHLAEGYVGPSGESEGQGGGSGGDDGAFDVETATVPELRAFLDAQEPPVEYKADDRKDALKARVQEFLNR